MTPQELLRRAADHIERYGKIEGRWIPDEAVGEVGEPKSRDCPACAGGALAMIVSGYSTFSPNFVSPPARRTMQQAIDLLVRELDPLGVERARDCPPLDWIIEWSDTHSTKEVVAGLRAAAG